MQTQQMSTVPPTNAPTAIARRTFFFTVGVLAVALIESDAAIMDDSHLLGR
jgi:hypothetical protein